jgi:NADPH:quinone reductase-like Zn-dependent oxidoreductase
MKAIVRNRYGPPDILELREVDPPEPGQGEVLVQVRAASVNPYDWHFLRGEPYFMRAQAGLRKPKMAVLGADIAGVVSEVGPDVSGYGPGDEVFCEDESGGGFAELATVSADLLEQKPANLSFEHAAAVPLAAMTALQALRDHGRLNAGERILIIGASGGVGTFAVQIAKSFGAHVTGVCSTRNIALVRSIGADAVIDYTREDFTSAASRFDLILQLAGMASPGECRRVLARKGALLLSSGDSEGRWIGPVSRVIKALAMSPFVSQRMVPFVAKPNKADLGTLRGLIESGEVTPVIDRTYELSAVPEAIAYLEQGHARGKVVITI